MSKRHYLLILLSLSLLTRFIFFGHPDETVFDEVHFGKFISAYYTGEFYFDIHPALGKQMIAGFAKLSDFKPEFAFAEIGDIYPNKQYRVLRFLPTLANALLPMVIFLLLIQIGIGPIFAFLGGLFIVFDNAILTQGRYILMDSFMLLFGFLSLYFYFKHKNSPDFLSNSKSEIKNRGSSILFLNQRFRQNRDKMQATYLLFLAGIFSGLALSIKWIALSFVALPLVFEGWEILTSSIKNKSFPYLHTGRLVLTLGLIPILIYFSVFMIDFSLLNKSGTGNAFMQPGFQKTLEGNSFENDTTVKPSNLLQKFNALNVEMYHANQRLNATHPYSSTWYSWPLMTRPIYYWVNGDARIYLIGNPVIWWLTSISVIWLLLNYLGNFKNMIRDKISNFLIAGYILNLLPFIGVKRVMFLYHYLTALIFSILIFTYILSRSFRENNEPPDWFDKIKSPKFIIGALLIITIGMFLFFSPLTYGLKLSPEAYESRVWIENWR